MKIGKSIKIIRGEHIDPRGYTFFYYNKTMFICYSARIEIAIGLNAPSFICGPSNIFAEMWRFK